MHYVISLTNLKGSLKIQRDPKSAPSSDRNEINVDLPFDIRDVIQKEFSPRVQRCLRDYARWKRPEKRANQNRMLHNTATTHSLLTEVVISFNCYTDSHYPLLFCPSPVKLNFCFQKRKNSTIWHGKGDAKYTLYLMAVVSVQYWQEMTSSSVSKHWNRDGAHVSVQQTIT